MIVSDRRPHSSRIAVRFAVILALALLPAGVIAFIQTRALEREISARSEVALMGATLQAAAAETGLIRRVRGMVGSLAGAVPFVVDDPEACSLLMRRVAEMEPAAAVAAFVPLSGLMTCSNVGRTYDFSDNPNFKETIRVKEPYFTVNPSGPISGTSILGISHPVFDIDGSYLGYVGMSLPHSALNEARFSSLANEGDLDAPLVFWTFDGKGLVLTANVDLEIAERSLPANLDLVDLVGSEGHFFAGRSEAGLELTYAVVPIVPDELYLMSIFLPKPVSIADTYGVMAYLPTLLMWLVGLVVSGVAAEKLVTRHVRTLNRSIVSFARGDRRLQDIDMKGAPAELSELATAYLAMTESIVRGEAELEDSVHQKEVLLREVHHRVKNNLQLISSIMNIQIRSARGGEAKDLLKNLQERIMSLATVHRGLYQTSGVADVRARELIPDIVRQIMSMSSGPERPFETATDIDDLRLVPDQAVPMSLLLAEALTNAIKHCGASREYPGRLAVRLKRSGGSDAVLEVTNSIRERLPDVGQTGVQDTGIGSQLITAFVQQLGGQQEMGESDGSYYLRVTFNVAPLAKAEHRQFQTPDDLRGGNASEL